MKIVFLSSSDVHGYVLPTDYQSCHKYDAPFGLSRVSSVIKAQRAKYGADSVVVADAGDCLQGSPLASYVHAASDQSALSKYTALYNAIDYDGRCLGNHDFNYGLDYLKDYIAHNSAPILNDNILDAATGQPAMGQPYQIIVKKEIKIGLLGITTQRIPYWEPAKNIAGLKFASACDQVKHYAQILRPQVDILAVVYHGGFEVDLETGARTQPATGENEGYRILTEVPEIDVFLTGHQHKKLSIVTRNTAIVQPGYRGEAVGKVVVDIDETSKKIRSMTAALLDTGDSQPDPEIVDLCANLNQETQKWLDQPIARLADPAPMGEVNQARLKGAPFINLLQQMQLHFTNADVSATAVMSETATGFGSVVTMRDLILNYPFANQLCRVRVTGKELRQIIEYSLGFLTKDSQGGITFGSKWRDQLFNFDVFYPVKYRADISRPLGHRLTQLELNGKTLEEDKVYYLAVNNYRAQGGGFYPCYSTEKIENIIDKDYVQMFQEFLTQNNVMVDKCPNYYFE